MSAPLPPPSLTARRVPTVTRRVSPPPRIGILRPIANQVVNELPPHLQKPPLSSVTSVLKLLGLLGLLATSVAIYQKHRQVTNDSLKTEAATSHRPVIRQ